MNRRYGESSIAEIVISLILFALSVIFGIWVFARMEENHQIEYDARISTALYYIEKEIEAIPLSWTVVDACQRYSCTPQSLTVETINGVYQCGINGERPICVKTSPQPTAPRLTDGGK